MSWPIPPDATFVSRPYSERVHLDRDTLVRRSWCAVQRRGRTSVQYYEQIRKGSDVSVSTRAHTLQTQAPVIQIQPASIGEKDFLVVQEDGSLNVFSLDGNASKYKCFLRDSQTPIKLLAAQSLSKAEAQSSVLKSRQDLVSTVADEALFVAATYQNLDTKHLHLGIWVFNPATASANSSTSLELLLQHDLHEQRPGSVKKASAEFVSGNTRLEIGMTTSVRTFDITTIVPLKLSEREHLVPDLVSSLELSPEISLYLTPGKLQVYNKKFMALQASSNLNSGTLKRKRDGDDTSRMTLIAYFSQMKRVLACNGNQLLAIDIHSRDGSRNPFRQGSLLIGNILRGDIVREHTSGQSSRHTYSVGRLEQEMQVQDWPIISKDLDSLAEQQDARGFEERFKSAFKLQRPKDLTSSKMPKSKADYLLSKIFAPNSTTGDATSKPIKVALVLPELLRWCISGGLLERSRVAQALQLSQSALSPMAVAQALLDVDLRHELLTDYVQRSPFIQPGVLTFIARSLINKVLQQSENETQGMLTNGQRSEADNLVAAQQLVLGARPKGMNTSTPATTCLAHTLKRLALTGPAIVSEQMRTSSFGQREVLALIQFLRQQLFLGGHTRLDGMREYPSPPASAAGEEVEDELRSDGQIPLPGLVTLLNGCIDALGPVGLLGSAEEGAFIEKMVPELLSEVVSASQAVEESNLLQGILRETLRYAESVERQPFEVRSKVENKATKSVGKGQIVTLYSEPDSAESGSLPGSALPLSLKAEEDVDKFKVRKGGQAQRRSAREIGMLKDRLKSPYAFERLVL